MTVSRIEGALVTRHVRPACVAGALQPDNLQQMVTIAMEDCVRTEVRGEKMRSVIASVDDYLMNLSIAEGLCLYGSD
ncbi:MAG: KEOPS complex subunit Pcc1 [Methanomicrobiales archaeon]|nr:KEOPS complex subunit Pcc1 [Methanomicrobiales archaeon]